MNIFKTLGGMLDDARIKCNYPGYECQARSRHMASAERRFSTAELELEVLRRMADSRQIAAQRFAHPVDELNAQTDRIQFRLQDSQEQLAIFARNYKAELDHLHDRKSQLFDELGTLKDAKDAAYADLEQASDDLDRWHAKSASGFFGNGGKQLPRHSLFRQSLGDRDGLKGDRDSAGEEIAACKEQVAAVKRSLDEVTAEIARIKADRQRMFDMREQGHSWHGLQHSISKGESLMADAQREIARLQSEGHEFILAAKHRTGTITLEAEIDKVRGLRDAFIRSFDTPEAGATRKLEHRQAWLKQKRH